MLGTLAAPSAILLRVVAHGAGGVRRCVRRVPSLWRTLASPLFSDCRPLRQTAPVCSVVHVARIARVAAGDRRGSSHVARIARVAAGDRRGSSHVARIARVAAVAAGERQYLPAARRPPPGVSAASPPSPPSPPVSGSISLQRGVRRRCPGMRHPLLLAPCIAWSLPSPRRPHRSVSKKASGVLPRAPFPLSSRENGGILASDRPENAPRSRLRERRENAENA